MATIQPVAGENEQHPDVALVERVRGGDVSAYDELVRKYERQVFRIAQQITQNREDAEDVMQDAFLKAYEKLDQFQGNSKFYTWLVRIAVNESLMRLRKRRTGRMVSIDEDIETDEGSVPRDLADWAPDPEQNYNQAELGEILRKTIQGLPQGFRMVFVLRDVEGLSTEETAETLGLSVPAVKSRLLRARLQLRERRVHVDEAGDGREGHVALHLLVVMHGVGGEHDRPRGRLHHDHGLPGGVTAHPEHLDPRRHVIVVLEQDRPPFADHIGQRLKLRLLNRVPEKNVARVGAGPEFGLRAGHHDLGLIEVTQVADVIVVRVSDDHPRRAGALDAQLGQGVPRIDQHRPAAGPARVAAEPGVDDNRAAVAPDNPEEVVHLHGAVRLAVGVVVEEYVAAGRRPGAVADDQHLMLAARHGPTI